MNILSKVKEFIGAAKHEYERQRGIKEAKQRIKFDIFNKNVELVETLEHPDLGPINVLLSDDYVTVVSEAINAPGAYAATENGHVIVVNTLALTSHHYDAIIQHEIGHLVYNHQPNPNAGKELRTGVGTAVTNEYEADDYAVSQGQDIKAVLIWLRDSYGFTGITVQQRIARL